MKKYIITFRKNTTNMQTLRFWKDYKCTAFFQRRGNGGVIDATDEHSVSCNPAYIKSVNILFETNNLQEAKKRFEEEKFLLLL